MKNPKHGQAQYGTTELIICMAPAIMLPLAAGDIETGMPQIIAAGLLGGVGGVIGGVLYWFTKNKNKKVKYSAYAITFIGTVLLVATLTG